MVTVFLIAGTYFVLLSQGFVIDFKNLRIQKVGAIFLSFKPTDAQLEINNELRKLPISLLQNGKLINNLTPGEYQLRLFKENFREWRKTTLVEPGLVTEFQNLILIPSEIKTENLLKEKIDDFWLTKAGIVYQKNENVFFEDELIKGREMAVAKSDSSFVISGINDNYFLTDLQSRAATINLSVLFNSLKQRQLSFTGFVPIKKIILHPFSPSKLLVFTDAALYELDLKKIKLELLTLLENDIRSETTAGNEIVAADANGNLITVNLVLKNKNVKNNLPEDIALIKINNAGGQIGLLSEKGEFILYDRNKNEIKKINERKVKNFYFSADDKYLIFLTADDRIEIFDLNKNKSWPLVLPPGDIKTISITKEMPGYVLIAVENRLIISETIAGEPTNWYEILTGVKKYELNGKELYLLHENGELKKTILAF